MDSSNVNHNLIAASFGNDHHDQKLLQGLIQFVKSPLSARNFLKRRFRNLVRFSPSKVSNSRSFFHVASEMQNFTRSSSKGFSGVFEPCQEEVIHSRHTHDFFTHGRHVFRVCYLLGKLSFEAWVAEPEKSKVCEFYAFTRSPPSLFNLPRVETRFNSHPGACNSGTVFLYEEKKKECSREFLNDSELNRLKDFSQTACGLGKKS